MLYKEHRTVFPMDALTPWIQTPYGTFLGLSEIDGVQVGLFANPQIGLFFKDKIFHEDMVLKGRLATPEEIEDIRKYLANKISEYEEYLKKLDRYPYEVQSAATTKRPI